MRQIVPRYTSGALKLVSMVNLYTQDGSITLKDEETGEWFHNSAGAYLEAHTNYIEPLCLSHWQPQRLKVLDSCFGLGYNSFALLGKLNGEVEIELTCIDKHREHLELISEVLDQTCFESIQNKNVLKEFFFSIHQAKENHKNVRCKLGQLSLSINFIVDDLRQTLPRLNSEDTNFDLVFHDPFSAQKMPELWTRDLFRLYFEMLAGREGKVLTYSTAHAVRGGFNEVGFSVYRTAAVGSKYGGTLAATACDSILKYGLDSGLIISLNEEELEKMNGRSGLPYRDPDFNLDRSTIFMNRQNNQDKEFPRFQL